MDPMRPNQDTIPTSTMRSMRCWYFYKYQKCNPSGGRPCKYSHDYMNESLLLADAPRKVNGQSIAGANLWKYERDQREKSKVEHQPPRVPAPQQQAPNFARPAPAQAVPALQHPVPKRRFDFMKEANWRIRDSPAVSARPVPAPVVPDAPIIQAQQITHPVPARSKSLETVWDSSTPVTTPESAGGAVVSTVPSTTGAVMGGPSSRPRMSPMDRSFQRELENHRICKRFSKWLDLQMPQTHRLWLIEHFGQHWFYDFSMCKCKCGVLAENNQTP